MSSHPGYHKYQVSQVKMDLQIKLRVRLRGWLLAKTFVLCGRSNHESQFSVIVLDDELMLCSAFSSLASSNSNLTNSSDKRNVDVAA